MKFGDKIIVSILNMSDDVSETLVERVELTVGELIVWITVWELLLLITSDYSKRTKIIIYTSLLLIALFLVIPVYRKRLRVKTTD